MQPHQSNLCKSLLWRIQNRTGNKDIISTEKLGSMFYYCIEVYIITSKRSVRSSNWWLDHTRKLTSYYSDTRTHYFCTEMYKYWTLQFHCDIFFWLVSTLQAEVIFEWGVWDVRWFMSVLYFEKKNWVSCLHVCVLSVSEIFFLLFCFIQNIVNAFWKDCQFQNYPLPVYLAPFRLRLDSQNTIYVQVNARKPCDVTDFWTINKHWVWYKKHMLLAQYIIIIYVQGSRYFLDLEFFLVILKRWWVQLLIDFQIYK